MEALTVSALSSRLTPVFDRYHVRKAVLFGSMANGTSTARSDIDLLVDSGLRGLRFVGLLEDVQNAAGMEVDLLDVTHVEKGSLIEREIADTGVVIYEK